jgi:hypothetical protein
MSEKEGVLRLQSSGRWAVCRSGHDPVEILSGELFRVEVDGELRVTRMEEVWGIVGLAVKPVGEPYSGNRDLRFDEQRWETG